MQSYDEFKRGKLTISERVGFDVDRARLHPDIERQALAPTLFNWLERRQAQEPNRENGKCAVEATA